MMNIETKNNLLINNNTMALGNAGNDNITNTFLLKLKIKGGLRFDVSKKEGEGLYTDNGNVKSVSGEFRGIYLRKGEFEGSPIYNMSITLVDVDLKEKYIIDVSLNSIGRNIANSLLSLDDGYQGPISISLYKNKKGYDSVSIKKGGENLDWVIPFEEQDKLIEKATLKGKVIRDYEKLDEMFFNKLAEKFNIDLSGNTNTKDKSEEVSVEDLPF